MFNAAKTWVKNVYSLCTQGVITSAQSYTPLGQLPHNSQVVRVQPQVIPLFLNSFTPYSYTAFFSQFNLLITHLYTVSTAPIIKKKKEK